MLNGVEGACCTHLSRAYALALSESIVFFFMLNGVQDACCTHLSWAYAWSILL